MKNEEVYREIFINNTIRLVAEGGFEMATTRAIAGDRRLVNDVKVNEAHIYRVFGTKENLFAEIFAMLDEELLRVIRVGIREFEMDRGFREECRILFFRIWQFLLHNEEKCRYYTRYYYSVYYEKDASQRHTEKYTPIIELMTPFFVENADVRSIFHHVMSSVLDFAIRVYSGAIPNDEDNAGHVFRVLYSSIALYLK